MSKNLFKSDMQFPEYEDNSNDSDLGSYVDVEDLFNNDDRSCCQSRYENTEEVPPDKYDEKQYRHKECVEIAVIGISGRFPGASNVNEFWDNLAEGICSIKQVPGERWDISKFYDPEAKNGEKTYLDRGGFIDDSDKFDSLFFNISGKEAELTDPQQRLFLEESWHALEDAGYTGKRLSDASCGVFVGVKEGDYQICLSEVGAAHEAQAFWGNDTSIVPARLSYFLNLRGPSIAVNTACSSSLTAIHMACESIHLGKCDMAVAGGVFVSHTPGGYIISSNASMLSHDGKCKAFDDRADGFVPGEAVGAVVLKPLDKALADRDYVYAVIKGFGINQDGRTNGITAPSRRAQAELEQEVYERAAVNPETIGYVETHGTGTKLGDPIEFEALTDSFRKFTDKTEFCAIGSVKTNIGHAAAAAGVTSFIKVIMALKNKKIPPSLNFEKPNKFIKFDGSPFFVNTGLIDWKHRGGEPRRGAVSSFGFSGTNVHILLQGMEMQEHVVKEMPLPCFFIPLSAKTKEALQTKVSDLIEWLEGAGKDYSMSSIAYTLQTGREHYSYRVSFIADNRISLLQQLRNCDLSTVMECNVIDAPDENDMLAVQYDPGITPNMDTGDYIKEINIIKEKYIGGETINWDILYHDNIPYKVPMPLYPFARKSFWLPGNVLPQRKSLDVLHPLIDSVLPKLLDHEVLFKKTLNSKDIVVSHHQVKSQSLLPGVAYLEMAHAAAKLLDSNMGIQLRGVVWLTPVVVEKNQDKEVNISLKLKDNYYEYEITGDNGEAIYSKGEVHPVSVSAERQYVPIEEIKSRSDTEINKDELYNRFQRLGLDYGEYLKSVTRIWSNGREVLAALELPQEYIDELETYTFHPAIMDGSIQAVIGLVKDGGADIHNPRLPFSVDCVTVLNPLKASGYVYIKPLDEEHFNLAVLDGSGCVCIKMENLTLRQYKDRKELFLFKPEWVEEISLQADSAALDSKRVVIVYTKDGVKLKDHIRKQHEEAEVFEILLGYDTRVLSPQHREISSSDKNGFYNCKEFLSDADLIYFLGGIQTQIPGIDDLKFLRQSQEEGVLSLYRLVKTLNMSGACDESLKLKIITSNTFSLNDSEMDNPFAGSIQGFALTLAKEYSHWEVSCVDIDINELDRTLSNEWSTGWVKQAITEPGHESGQNVLLRRMKRYVRRFMPVELPDCETLPFRNDGVYMILGGAGGIGLELAAYLAETAKTKLALIGRSTLKPAQEEKINHIRSLGSDVLYLQADGTDYDSMVGIVTKVKERFGQINGAFHSAIVLKDKTLANMDENTFRSVLSPKTDASMVLYKVLRDEPIDFLVYFSSIQSFTGNAGQGNYAAGCTFKDSYAHALRKMAPFKVRTINWGYWGTVGVVSSEQYYQRFTSQGALSIEPKEGFDAVSRIVSAPIGQVMAFKAKKNILDMLGVNWNNKIEFQKPAIPSCIELLLGKLVIDDSNASPVNMDKAFKILDHFGRTLLLGYFRKSGYLLYPDEQHVISDMKEKMGVIPEYDRLFDALIDILGNAGWIRTDGSKIVTLEAVGIAGVATQDEKDRLSALYPDMAAHLNLLWICINAFKNVLSGKVNHMEVMFPGGSASLVEKIYKGDRMSDYFNKLTAQILKEYVKELIKNDPEAVTRIIEVGAGTGGTSAFVLKALDELKCSGKIHYFYTDISNGFIKYAENTFGHRYPFIEFKTLNIEEEPATQGFNPGTADIVFASNVVHATKSMPNTLNQIKKLLKKNGLLVINEATRKQDFGTLTFGLTGGWWLFDDVQNRIPNSPLLSPLGWRNILKAQGFDKVHTFGVPGMDSDTSYQSIVISESTGEIRCSTGFAGLDCDECKNIKSKPAGNVVLNSQVEPVKSSVEVSGETLHERTIDYLKGVFAEILRIKKGDIEENATFEKYGIDSLIVMEITKRLEKDFKKLSATLLFENPTIEKLAGFLLRDKQDVLGGLFVSEQTAAPAINTQAFDADNLFSANGVKIPPAIQQIDNTTVMDSKRTAAGQKEDIAIIGISGRYPLSDSLEEFWSNLEQGGNCITEIPKDRWNCDEYFQSGSSEPGKSYSKWGGFVKDHDKFDTFFFNISPLEAEAMDPQERLFLETAWSAMEDAGYSRHNIDRMDNQIGVFVGIMNGNYESIGGEEWGKGNFTGAHSAYWSVANRVSYFFNIQGPSMVIDTACSSSLTAIHLACESIKRGECKAAIAGGVNLILHPMHYAKMTGMKMLSKGGSCKAFGDGADGFVDGEGVGAVLLKPLNKAIEDGDNIYAVIKGSFINSGGKTSGYTVPNPNAQARLIEEALKRSGVEPISISYLEAHGTGTALGDPIEITGLKKAFHASTDDPAVAKLLNTQYCAIGSVKSNIGHLESASGIAGLTKLILMFKYKKLVASINSEVLNPNIDFEDSPFYVVQKETEWRKPKYVIESVAYEYPRRAGISSFGAGGANAHMILEEYEGIRPLVNNDEDQVVVLSARNESRLHEYAVNLKCFVEKLLNKDKAEYTSDQQDKKAVCDSLIKTIAEILEVPEESIDPSEELEILGLNNFIVNEFIKRIYAEFTVKLKPSAIFRMQNINQLANYIAVNRDAQADGIKNDKAFSYHGDINLPDIAFTLQTGREPMAERLAIVASDLRGLCGKLEEFIQGGSGIEGIFHGNIKVKNEGLEGVFNEKGGRDLTFALLEERKLKALAKLWVSGVDVEWNRLARSAPARIVPVPTYPFARERYWVKRKSNTAGTGEGPIHNLIDRVVPILADNSITFEKIFLPSDPIVEHHKVNNQKMLPGVGYVAIANVAVRQLFPGSRNCINRVVWLNPVVVDEQPKVVNITVFKRGEQLEYEVASQNKDTKIVHSKGTFGNGLPDNDIQYIKLDEIKARCKTNITSEELYSTYSEMGIQYGEYYRTVKKIWGNGEEVLALLDKTVNVPWIDEDNYTDTGILDGALQAILALMALKGNDDKTLRIPFSVDKVEFLAPIKLPMYVFARPSGHDGFNLILADEKGRICVRFTEVTSRALNLPKTDISYTFKWVPYHSQQAQVPENGGRNVLILHSGSKNSIKLKTDLEGLHTRDRVNSLCLDENLDRMPGFINNCSAIDVVYFIAGVGDYMENWNSEDCLEYAQKYGVAALLRLVKLLASHPRISSKPVLKIVVNKTYPVFQGDEIYPLFAGLTGMSKSIAKEYLNWNVSCIDISNGQPEEVLGIVKEPAHKNGEDIALRNGRRYLRMIEPLKMEAPNYTNLRKGGVYMIVGGAGGIGLTFAGYLAEKYSACIALVGRSELSNIQRDKIASIKAKGSNVIYLKADVTDLGNMKEAIQRVKKEVGAINGVFHSAIVLKDSTINNMDETVLNEVLAPKVKGSLVLNKALEDEKLDFLVFFSSAQSFMGNAGQGNYAAACTFKDSYAHYMNSVSNYPVKIINWGYWGSVGVVASDNYRKKLAEKGLLSIEPAEGCEAFEAFLANPLNQVVILKADASLQKSMRIDTGTSWFFYRPQYKTLFHEKSRIVVPEMKDPTVLENLWSSVKELEKLAGWLLVDVLHKEHIIQEHETMYNMDELKERLKVAPKYDRLFNSLLDILERGGYCRVENQKTAFIALKDNSDLVSILEMLPSKREEIINRYPAVKAQANLLWTCMLRFREMLTGEIEATEVIFPGSSMELVEGIYRDNRMADELNKLVAQAVRLFVTSCSPLLKEKRPLTILEIGAGTGGTTKLVLEALKETGIEIKYIYTDISQSFILYGKKTFGSQYPFVDFKVLDIEKDITGQGMEHNSVDLVIAANVLHATRNLRYTLEQVKTVLRPNGWLVLNEATQLHDPTTLTFGLLEGWWLYEDEDLRIPNSPLLSANMWEVLLKEEGFKQTYPVLGEGAQNIILAESDGGVLIRVKPGKVYSTSIMKNTDRKLEQIVPVETAVKPGNIKDRILDITAKVLQTDVQNLSEDAPFTDFGVDSILAVEIVNQINSVLGISLRATDLFNYSSIATLNGYIEEQWGNMLLETEAAIQENITNTPDNERSCYFQEDYSLAPQNEVIKSSPEYSSDVKNQINYPYEIDSSSIQNEVEENNSLDIAIIGMAGEFPEAGDTWQFWDNLSQGRNSVKRVSSSRWNLDEALIKGKEIRAGQLSDIDMFDPLFFNISPREAEWMDPQQRKFLQTSWNALEDAGYADKELNGKKCGVFVGCGAGDYVNGLVGEAPEVYSFLGNSNSILAARISYLLNLKGPSIAIDTACSSSLVAVHLACESLKSGTSEIAIAGGVSIPTSPQFHLFSHSAGLLSTSGQCRAFDKEADGFIPGEAVGAVILKPLKAAVTDGDHIYAVIRGSGMNQDGKSNGITAPNGVAQTSLEREVYDKFNINPETVTFIEAHGTGTKLGDPIEIHSLTDAFKTYTQKTGYCAIGSVKTNIGHALTAAGIAGLIKVILCLKYKKLVPSLHFKEENPHFKLNETPFYVNTEYKDWDNGGGSPRRAAISSFGFSGTNAHMVLEEAGGQRKTAICRPCHAIPLSAKTQEALERKISDLAKWLNNEGSEYTFGDIAYTLHFGRSHFEKRAVFIASNKEELAEKLIKGLSGAVAVNIYEKDTSVHNKSAEYVAVLLKEVAEPSRINDEEFKAKLASLAENYVNGCEIDWRVLYPKTSFFRVPLPGYPFAKERYWLENATNVPLINHSKMECRGEGIKTDNRAFDEVISVKKTLSADEEMLRDHKALGKSILPGVGYLELVRSEYYKTYGTVPVSFDNVYWISPLIAEEDKMDIEIVLSGEEYPLDCMVRSCKCGKETTHFKANVSQSSGKGRTDYVKVDHITKNTQYLMSKDEIYSFFDSMGLNYGPYFQCIDYLWIKGNEALGALSTKSVCQEDLDGYILHPGLMDSALQVIVGLVAGRKASDRNFLMPFSVEKVEILRPLELECFAYVKAVSDNCYSVSIIDKESRLCIQMDKVRLQKAKEIPGTMLYAPLWVKTEFADNSADNKHNACEPVLIVYAQGSIKLKEHLADVLEGNKIHELFLDEETAYGIKPGDIDGLEARIREIGELRTVYFISGVDFSPVQLDDINLLDSSQKTGVYALFNLVKVLHKLNMSQEHISFKIVTTQTHAILPGEAINPYSASLTGFALSMSKEVPKWKVNCIDVNEDIGSLAGIISETGSKAVTELALRGQQAYTREFIPVHSSYVDGTPYRKGGVYLIAGGAGGIGLELAKYLSEKEEAKLVLVGRSPLDELKLQAMEAVKAAGGEITYLQGDITDLDSMTGVVSKVKNLYGGINGVFHSAIVLRDMSILRMSEDDFKAAFSPKVNGSVVLYKALKDEKLDFMMFFSSIQSFIGNVGQSNYAAGSTFKDAFASALRNCVNYPVYTINWGYWGSVGIVSDDSYREQFEAQGIGSIQPHEGMEAVKQVLGNLHPQVMVFKANEKILEHMGVNRGYEYTKLPEDIPSCSIILEERADTEIMTPGTQYDNRQPFEELQMLALKLLVSAFRKMGAFISTDETYATNQLYDKLNIIPNYYKLMDSIIDMLCRQDVLCIKDDKVSMGQAFMSYVYDDGELDSERQALIDNWPEMGAYIELLWKAVKSYHGVLTGKTGHMEVLFPQGSMSLVEAVYKGNRLADYFNEMAADSVSSYVAQRVKANPDATVNILEIGAGTGGTTRFVLDKLKPYEKNLTYHYTDISIGFIEHGTEVFGNDRGNIRFKLLNIEEDPIMQGFQPGSMDLLLAGNVLHATRLIPNTLNNAKKLLKTNGVFVINEATARQDFATLTFGLTGGWWLFEDPGIRIKGSPLLNVESWRKTLAETGFKSVSIHGLSGEGSFGQNVIICESDGVVLLEKKANVEPCLTAGKNNPVQEKHTSGGHSMVLNINLQEKLEDYIKDVFAKVLKVKKSSLESSVTFDKYGVDSLIVMEINKEFEKDFGSLPATMLFENITVEKLAGYFISEHNSRVMDKFGVGKPLEQNTDVVNAVKTGNGQKPVNLSKRPLSAITVPAVPFKESMDEDIAVIGLGGHYPESEDLGEFWTNIKEGRNCITEIPSERWDWEEYFDPDYRNKGKSYSRWGGFIKDADKFDPLFFNISPREAEAMDPQERLFLETAWETLEDAGYNKKKIEASNNSVGVFVGVMNPDYELIAGEQWGRNNLTGAHSAYWAVANRISYVFNFNGPSFTVDTACSSSLTAIHLACESIKRKECELALAGGINLILHPMHYIRLSGMNMLSKDDKLKSFGDGADGFVDGEGVGAILLKPLSRAVADGDRIYGVIKGSFINSGGKTSGFTVPNPNAQADLIYNALKRSNIDPATISYIEAHGTGTELGDPIEISGLQKGFSKASDNELPKQYCAIGSVKSNIGHLESAAGIAAVSKILLMLKHRMLVPTINCEKLNRNIRFEETSFYVQKKLSPWESEIVNGREQPRRAGISSFGAGGANAHLILEEFIPGENNRESYGMPKTEIIVLSAKSEQQLKEYASKIVRFLEYTGANGSTQPPLESIAYTLQTGREAMDYRLALVVSCIDELADALNSHIKGQENSLKVYTGSVEDIKRQLDFLSSDEDSAELVYRWMEKGKFEKVAQLWTKGFDIDWEMLYNPQMKPSITSLPTYPFRKKRYWIKIADKAVLQQKICQKQLHPLLQSKYSLPLVNDIIFESNIHVNTEPYFKDHKVSGKHILSGSAFIAMLMEAVKQTGGSGPCMIEDLVFSNPLELKADTAEKIQVCLSSKDDESYLAKCIRVLEQEWNKGSGNYVLHVGAKIRKLQDVENTSSDNRPQDLMKTCTAEVKVDDYYKLLESQQITLGNSYRCTDRLLLGEGQVVAWFKVPEEQAYGGSYQLHPGLIDSLFQLAFAAFVKAGEMPEAYLPHKLEQFKYYGAANGNDELWGYAAIKEFDKHKGIPVCDLVLCSGTTKVLEIKGFTQRRIHTGAIKHELSMKGYGIFNNKWNNQELNNQFKDADKPDGNWIIFMDNRGLGRKVVDYLNKNGCNCTLVYKGTEIKQNNGNTIVIDPSNTQLYRDILRDRDYDGILYLWALDGCELKPSNLISNQNQQFEGTYSMLYMVQALVEKKSVLDNGIVIVTHNAQAVKEGQLLNLEQSTLWGLGKVINSEYPLLHCRCIDIDSLCFENTDLILKDILTTQKEHLIGWRDGQRYVENILYEELDDREEKITVYKNKSYLITGGLHGLGLKAAEWLTKKGAASIILIGRSKPSKETLEKIKDIEATGVNLKIASVDISDQSELEALFREIEDMYPKLAGVIHCAGILEDALLINQTVDKFKKVMAAKVVGSWNIHCLTEKLKLDFFIFFSSISSAVGLPGQANYAAANSFMDALAYHRRAMGLAGLSISWGPWKEIGMVTKYKDKIQDYQTHFEEKGIDFISPDDGFEIMDVLLSKNIMHAGVVKLGGEGSFLKSRAASKLAYDTRISHQQETYTEKSHKADSDTGIIYNLICGILGLSVSELNPEKQLIDFGLDSIMALEISSQVRRRFKVEVPVTKFLAGLTTKDLVEMVERGANDNVDTFLEGRQEVAKEFNQLEDKQPHPIKNGLLEVTKFELMEQVHYAKKILEQVDLLSDEDIDCLFTALNDELPNLDT